MNTNCISGGTNDEDHLESWDYSIHTVQLVLLRGYGKKKEMFGVLTYLLF